MRGIHAHRARPLAVRRRRAADHRLLQLTQLRGIDGLYEQCQEEGIVHENAPLEEKPWGFREFAVRDHDGNLVTFFEPPEGYDPA